MNQYIDSTDISDKVSGSAICCNSASASVTSFQLFDDSTSETTISFYLKTCAGCYGVIFSYNNKKPFSLDYNGKLSVYYGKKEWKSEIKLLDNIWYQIVLSYSEQLRRLDLYVFNNYNKINPESEDFTIEFNEPNPFENGGDLSLGKFQVSQEIKKWKKTDSFVGCYDSLGFASRYLILSYLK